MSRSVEGVLALNLVFGAAGLSIVWALRGIRDLLELAQLAAPALLLGAASIGVLESFELYAGEALSRGAVLALAALLAFAALAFGIVRRQIAAPSAAGPAPPRRQVSWSAWALAALCGVFSVLLLALASVQPPSGHDGSSLWLTRAAAVSFGPGQAGLAFDPTAAHVTEPLLVPALQAMDFAFARSVDPAALTLQAWTLYIAFLLSVRVLLLRLVPPWLSSLFLAASLFAPQVDASITSARSDLPFAVFFASAGLFLARWLQERGSWLLAAFAATLAASLAANTYGQLLALCLAGGGVLALLGGEQRRTLALGAATAAAFASTIPFALWVHRQRLGGAVVPLIPSSSTAAGSAWHGLTAAVQLLFAYHLWLIAVPVALASSAASVLLSPRKAVPRLALGTIVLAALGLALCSISSRHGSPLPLASAGGAAEAVALFSAALTPFLVSALLPSIRRE